MAHTMTEKKQEKKVGGKPGKDEGKLEPCTKPHSSETARPDEEEDACDEGVK